jgi:hypothetical protein
LGETVVSSRVDVAASYLDRSPLTSFPDPENTKSCIPAALRPPRDQTLFHPG